jgi:hypothetical protein
MMTTDPDTARKAIGQLIEIVVNDTRYYPKAKSAILSDLEIVYRDIITTPLTITPESVQASQRLRVNLNRFRPSVSAAKDQTVFLYSLVWPVVEGEDAVDAKILFNTVTPAMEYRP